MIISLEGSFLGVSGHEDSPDDPIVDIPQCLLFFNHLNTSISLYFHCVMSFQGQTLHDVCQRVFYGVNGQWYKGLE